jgi:alanyl-tRNA synthetase
VSYLPWERFPVWVIITLIMTGNQLRQKYLDFYVKRGHVQIPSAPLVPENDPTTLFTSSGMQPLVPYLLGQPHPLGKRLVDSQKSFRSQDIDEVGDNRHTTFFEMLGNWSLGDYFKEKQLPWVFEFVTRELGLDPHNLYVSVFSGNASVPKDDESVGIWKKVFQAVGIDAREGERILVYPAKKNWWSRSGEPEYMPVGEPGGPDSEIFYDFGEDLGLHEKSPYKDEKCHPNCDCGRFLEIGNSVFMQYQKQADGSLKDLPAKNVDFGGGLERMLAAANHTPDVFTTDLFAPIIEAIDKYTGISYDDSRYQSAFRVIADHFKASVMLIADGVMPSNKAQGYMLRRLIRRAAVKMKKLTDQSVVEMSRRVGIAAGAIYSGVYLDDSKAQAAAGVISEEVERFDKVLNRGLKEISRYQKIDGTIAFDLLQTFGFPWELTYEIATEQGQHPDINEFKAQFARHQELSRTASKGMFKGGLEDHSEITTKYHTATHLLHKALRDTLGTHVSQKGSNITADRLRFDFSHPDKMSADQIKKVEDIVNEKIRENLPVTRQEMPKTQALSEGALAFFVEKYPDQVSVYTIGPLDHWYSKELCGGPHVSSTAEIGKIKIVKEESAGAGIRRIYAQITK